MQAKANSMMEQSRAEAAAIALELQRKTEEFEIWAGERRTQVMNYLGVRFDLSAHLSYTPI